MNCSWPVEKLSQPNDDYARAQQAVSEIAADETRRAGDKNAFHAVAGKLGGLGLFGKH